MGIKEKKREKDGGEEKEEYKKETRGMEYIKEEWEATKDVNI